MPAQRADIRAAAKRATNVTLDSALVADAKALGVNLSHAAEQGIAEAIRQKQAEEWLAANRAALESSNAYVEANGLPLSRFRQF